MAVCASCGVRHAPYTCAQYQALRQAENAADEERTAARRKAAAAREEAGGRRRWWRISRKRARPT
jgi:hypothetical protein